MLSHHAVNFSNTYNPTAKIKPKAVSFLPYPGRSPIIKPPRRNPTADKITLPALNAKHHPTIETIAEGMLKPGTATYGSPCFL